VSKTPIQLNINGREYRVEVTHDQSLVDVLRDVIKLTGTKKGCNSGECGSCTVLLDGEPVASCILPAAKAQGTKIITVEGLGAAHNLHLLQKAFLIKGAVQCGFCTPGMLMSAKSLLDKNPKPTAQEIKVAISGNLCRCTGYKKIVEAVQAAAAEMRGEQPVEMPAAKGDPVGASVIRVDGIPKVTGEAKYADDYSFPNMLYAKVLFSSYPHALIKNINTEKTRALAGVAGVYTAKDIPGPNRCGALPHVKDQPVLADEKVRHYGDAVAVVVAESLEIAEQALKLIDVDYEPLPGVFSVEEALAPGAPEVHAGGNLLLHRKIYKGDIEKGFQEADAVVEDHFKTPMNEHAYIEPESAVAVYDGGVVKVYAISQGVHHHRAEIAANLNLPISKVRVIQTVTGGGFGGKIDNSVHVLVALSALRTGRPVKLTFSREESMIASTKRHPFTMRYKLGAKKDGRLVAAQVEIYGDTGAYSSFGPAVLTRTATCAIGPYEVANAKIDTYAVYTNNPVSGAMRAFGSPQAQIAYESLMDELANKLGISPLAIRRINAYKEGSSTVTGQVLSRGVGMLETIDRVVEKAASNENLLEGKRK
jgi:CO/xanthine dehydrogenase Mo-binding subunit/aerobic-type carbon monoxide dehydrogenase small subunit (CoxS/CutS family)